MAGGGFDDAAAAAYHANLAANVPGLSVLHQLTDQLLTEAVPDGGRLLIVGAGGGAEIAHLAARHPTWQFDGVDPSAPMLQLAAHTLGERGAAATWIEGYVDDAPAGPYDAATCLLVLHFLAEAERVHTLAEIHRRLRPGQPLITFQHSVPEGPERTTWLRRAAAHALGPGADPAVLDERAAAMATKLPALTPAHDERLLAQAGFREIGLFYAALSLRGWIATA